jgi:hypothetical protein
MRKLQKIQGKNKQMPQKNQGKYVRLLQIMPLSITGITKNIGTIYHQNRPSIRR